ncbi:MAG: coiled-coil domain-containing protein, partial [Promethearchaeota archaeon]
KKYIVFPMTEEKSTLNIIDKTLRDVETNFKIFIDVLESARKELIELENDKLSLSNEKEILEAEKIQLEDEKSKLEVEKKRLEQDKNKLEEETQKLEKEKQERDQKIGAMTEEQMKLLDEYKKVKVELKKFMQAAAEAEEAEYNFDRVRALLSIYTALVSEIWQGQPHYRILYTLHGDKEAMTREELKNTTGIGGAYILHSVQELAKVGLLEYDMDTGTAKLKKRLFPKKALEEK